MILSQYEVTKTEVEELESSGVIFWYNGNGFRLEYDTIKKLASVPPEAAFLVNQALG